MGSEQQKVTTKQKSMGSEQQKRQQNYRVQPSTPKVTTSVNDVTRLATEEQKRQQKRQQKREQKRQQK